MENYEGMIIIHDYMYKFNELRNGLISSNGHSKGVLFYQLEKEDQYYTGYFDPIDKTFHNKNNPVLPYVNHWWQHFAIPIDLVQNGHLMEWDRIAEYNQQSIKGDLGYRFIDKELSDRLNGKLQKLEIDGLWYTIDPIARVIRQDNNENKKFCFPQQALLDTQAFFYHEKTKQPFEIMQLADVYPSDVVCVHFPCLAELDPVGFINDSLLNNIGDGLSVLTRTTWKADNHAVKIYPLKEIDVSSVILQRRYYRQKEWLDKEEQSNPQLANRRLERRVKRWKGHF